MSAQKALQGSETETRELLGGTEENGVFPDKGSFICPPGKSMTFHKKETEKIELVARPVSYQDTAVDIQALEDASFVSAKKVLKKGGLDGPMSPKARGPMSPKAGESADSEAAKKKRKKKNKKKRLPKNLNVEPDPERWLPRRERTGYR